MTRKKKKENEEVFILNKPFQGAYAEKDGVLPHEIINFFKADNDRIFIYNNPYGQCPTDIEFLKGNPCTIKYMLFVKNATLNKTKNDKGQITKSSTFYLTHRIKIKKLYHFDSTEKTKLAEAQGRVRTDIKKDDIRYGGKLLYEIYGQGDKTLYLTFEAEKVYMPKDRIPIEVTTPDFVFARNKGYVLSKTNEKAFEALKEKTKDELWEDVTDTMKRVNVNTPNTPKQKTFLDLIMKAGSEECYTNMLYMVLDWKNTMNLFAEEFTKNKKIDSASFHVDREVRIPKGEKIKGGRTDVCAYNDNQRIVIENKVFSGLNGVNKTNNTTQLTIYYNWAKKGKMDPICLISCPNFRVEEIKSEMEPGMEKVFGFVLYSEISDFIKNLNATGHFKDFPYEKYVDDIANAFAKYNYQDKSELFEQLFIEAINKANP